MKQKYKILTKLLFELIKSIKLKVKAEQIKDYACYI